MLNEQIRKLNVTDYSVRFEYNDVNYEMEFYDLITFIRDYYCPDDIIGDFDDLCYLVESFANSYDMIQVLRLCNNLTQDMLGSEYFIIDSVYLEVLTVDNVKELLDIYDIEDILNEMVENDIIGEYCNEL